MNITEQRNPENLKAAFMAVVPNALKKHIESIDAALSDNGKTAPWLTLSITLCPHRPLMTWAIIRHKINKHAQELKKNGVISNTSIEPQEFIPKGGMWARQK